MCGGRYASLSVHLWLLVLHGGIVIGNTAACEFGWSQCTRTTVLALAENADSCASAAGLPELPAPLGDNKICALCQGALTPHHPL